MARPGRVERPSVPTLSSPYGIGGSTAMPALDDLSDVDASSPADGDTLVWDSGLGLWVPGAPSGSSGGLWLPGRPGPPGPRGPAGPPGTAGATGATGPAGTGGSGGGMVPALPVEMPRPIGPPGHELSAVPPVTQAFSDVASPGRLPIPARVDHVHGMPANPGAAGSSGIVYGSLKPSTPDFDFEAALSGWTAVSTAGSFAIGNCHAQAIDGSHLWMAYSSQAGYIYQSASNVDQEWIVGGLVSSVRISNGFMGIALLDSAGTGVGLIYHTSDNTGALIGITTNLYDAGITAQIFTSPRPGNFIGTPSKVWFRLTRVGNVWDGWYSEDGANWNSHIAATISRTVTVARRCIGVFNNVTTCQLVADYLDTV